MPSVHPRYSKNQAHHAQAFEPIDEPPKNPNNQPYLEYNASPKVAPIESKFRRYDGQAFDPSDANVYPSLSQQKNDPNSPTREWIDGPGFPNDPEQRAAEQRYKEQFEKFAVPSVHPRYNKK